MAIRANYSKIVNITLSLKQLHIFVLDKFPVIGGFFNLIRDQAD